MERYQIDAPLFPVLQRPLEERMAPGLMLALVRWALGGAMLRDDDAAVSRRTGGRA